MFTIYKKSTGTFHVHNYINTISFLLSPKTLSNVSYFNRFVKSDRAVLLMNLCVALIIAYALFLGGVARADNQVSHLFVPTVMHDGLLNGPLFLESMYPGICLVTDF